MDLHPRPRLPALPAPAPLLGKGLLPYLLPCSLSYPGVVSTHLAMKTSVSSAADSRRPSVARPQPPAASVRAAATSSRAFWSEFRLDNLVFPWSSFLTKAAAKLAISRAGWIPRR